MDASGERLYKILTTPTYSLVEASQLARMTTSRVRRWLHGYEYEYAVQDETRHGKSAPVVRHGEEPQASFLDLVDLLVVKRLLDKGFTLQYLRQALDEARIRLGTPHFAQSKFFANPKALSLELDKDSKYIITLVTGGQSVMAEVVETLDDQIDFEEVTGHGLATRWYPLRKDGLIVVDPQMAFGRPTLVGRGVATENIHSLFLGEHKKVGPVSEWFQIPSHEIRAAVNFQAALAAA